MSKKSKKRKPINKRSASQFEMPRVSSRNGKQLPNYNEAAVDWDLSESDDGYDYPATTEDKGESSKSSCEAAESANVHLQAARMPSTASTTTSETASMVSPCPLHPPPCSTADPLATEDDEKDEPTRNLRFLVKWQGYSHIHNTWETYEYLKRFKGFKRVENYIKGVWLARQRILNDPATSREDLEALEIDKERMSEQLDGYKIVERIIAERNAPANHDIDHDHR